MKRGNTRICTPKAQARRSNITQNDIYELRIKTQQLDHKTTLLKTQLSRLQDKINVKNNLINHTFESSTNEAPRRQDHKGQLQKSIDGARNRLECLNAELEEAIVSDSVSMIKELQAEVRMAYCEHQRLSKLIEDRKMEASAYDRLLVEVDSRASSQHLAELRNAIRELRAVNSDGASKLQLYQNKSMKMSLEGEISQHSSSNTDMYKIMNMIELKRANLIQTINEMNERMEKEKEKHTEDMHNLLDVYIEQKNKLIHRLKN